MKTRLVSGLIAAVVMVTAAPVLAHHPFAAEYDRNKAVHLTGTVNKVDWANPHTMLSVDAKDGNGQAASWMVELGGPNALKRRGWSQTTVKMGDQVTIDGWQAKDGSNKANARSVTLSNGKELNAASSYSSEKSAKKRNTH